MNIVVCCKLVPEEQDIRVSSNRSISYEDAERKIGDYDLVALEAVAQLADDDDVVYALCLGDNHLDNTKLCKAILSKGPDELWAVKGASPEALDSYQTASVLKSAVEEISDVDLVICGEGSADLYAQQVGIMLGELLQWTTMNAVSFAEVIDGGLRVNRSLEDKIETLVMQFPAVISVSADFVEPRITSMKDILAAGKKPVIEKNISDFGAIPGSSYEVVSVLAPLSCEREEIVVEGCDDAAVEQFVESLRKNL